MCSPDARRAHLHATDVVRWSIAPQLLEATCNRADRRYQHPLDGTQAVLVDSVGLVCLGMQVTGSTCASGAPLGDDAACSDGTETEMRASEFDFQFVVSGTTTPSALMNRIYT